MCDNDRIYQLLCAEIESKAELTPDKKRKRMDNVTEAPLLARHV
jgi:hypothetical protein